MKRLLLKYQHFLLYTLFGGLTTVVDLILTFNVTVSGVADCLL